MNVRDAIRIVRQARTDDNAVQADGAVGTRQWTDDEIIDALREAQDEACERANLLRDEFTDAVTLITIVADQAAYTLHRSIYDVEYVRYEYDGTEIALKSEDALNAGECGGSYDAYGWRPGVPGSGAWRTRTGSRSRAALIQRTARERLVLRLTPIGNEATYTDSAGTEQPLKLRLSVYRRAIWPLKVASDQPEIHERYHIQLLDWVLGRLYEKNDSDANNDQRSQQMYARFDRNFGPRIDADAQRTRFEKRRNTTRPYGIT